MVEVDDKNINSNRKYVITEWKDIFDMMGFGEENFEEVVDDEIFFVETSKDKTCRKELKKMRDNNIFDEGLINNEIGN